MMKLRWSFACVAVAQIAITQPQNQFDPFFTDQVLRIDYFHSGTATEERIAIDQIYAGGEWPESRTHLIDDSNLGNYLLRVSDAATNQMIFSRGYATLFNEWQTTDEAKRGVFKTMHETARMPLPKKPVLVEILRRDKQNYFSRQLFFAKQRYWNKVGAFEGAGYLTKGLYRPTLRSIMISGTRDFGPVNTAAIMRMIEFYTK